MKGSLLKRMGVSEVLGPDSAKALDYLQFNFTKQLSTCLKLRMSLSPPLLSKAFQHVLCFNQQQGIFSICLNIPQTWHWSSAGR